MSALNQYLALTRRSIVNTARQPATIIPSIAFPLIFLTMTSAALGKSTGLDNFPQVDSFVQFAIMATITQGVLFGAVGAGTDMARDIEGGFFDRLIASPVARTSIVVGRIGGAALLGIVQTLTFIAIITIFGVRVAGGLEAVGLVAVVVAILAAGVGSITVAMGLRTGSSEAVQGSFPLIFVFLFLSSAFFPRELMHGWYHGVASLNPLSHLIEGLRHQIIVGVDIKAWATSLAIAIGIFVFGVGLALLALRGRLKANHG